jgi:hypothetical protein
MTDLYRVLGVSPRATAGEIKSAYRRLARKCHPDVSASPDANSTFARINEAYHVLSDARLRSMYDRGLIGESRRTFYASRTAEVVALQREFDRMVDEMIAHDRQETAARSHAVLVVVPLFLSTFYVMVAKPPFMEESRLIARVLIIALAMYGLVYLIKNIALVLTRYTYQVPAELISVRVSPSGQTNQPQSRVELPDRRILGFTRTGLRCGQVRPERWAVGQHASQPAALPADCGAADWRNPPRRHLPRALLILRVVSISCTV